MMVLYDWSHIDITSIACVMTLRLRLGSRPRSAIGKVTGSRHAGPNKSNEDDGAPVAGMPASYSFLSKAFLSVVYNARIILAAAAMMVSMASAFAGVPFVTDDADMPDARHFEINIAAQYTRFRGGSVGGVPSVDVNYGLTSKIELTARTQAAMSHIDGVGTNVGLGDVELSVKYRFIESDDWGWQPAVAFAPSLFLPSGSEVRGLGNGRTQGFLTVWLSKDFNQWNVFSGGGYNINPGPARRDWWFAGLGATRELDPTWTIGAEIYYNTPIANGLKNNVGFNVGVIYNINDRHHLLYSIGRNLVNAHENNELTTYLGYQLTF